MRGAALLALALAACASRPNPAEAPCRLPAPAPVVVAPLSPPPPADPVPPCVGGACALPPAWSLPSETPAPQAPVAAPVAPVAQPAPAAAQPAPSPPVPAQRLPEAASACQWDYLWWLAGAMAFVGVALWLSHRWGRLPPLLPAVAALLLAGCTVPVYLPEVTHQYDLALEPVPAPTPPEPSNLVPLLWTGAASAAAGAGLVALKRRKTS